MRIVLVLGLAGLCLLRVGGIAHSAEDGTNADSRANAVSLTIMSGSTFDGTAVIARDLAALVRSGSLRAVPMIGEEPAQTLRDVLGDGDTGVRVDLGVTHSTALNHYARSGELGPLKDRLVYVAKLFNEDLHLLARTGIAAVGDLDGKVVNVGPQGSATEIAAEILFAALELDIQASHLGPAEAMAQLKAGTLDAAIVIGTMPIAGLSQIGPEDGVKLLPVPYPRGLEDDTYPAVLTHDDYPALIESGERVDTVGICAVLVALSDTVGETADAGRETKLDQFVDRFFSRFDALLQPPNHSKWQEVNFAATLEGWRRAPQAQAWLDTSRSAALADARERESFKKFLTQTGDIVSPGSVSDTDQEKLFRAFKAWSKTQQAN